MSPENYRKVVICSTFSLQLIIFNSKIGKVKAEIINIILQSQNISTQLLDATKTSLSSSSHSNNPPHHHHYTSTFNGVDLIDKYWYKIQHSHTIQKWHSKFILSILQVGIINAWTLFKFLQPIELLDFYENLSKVLTDPNLKL